MENSLLKCQEGKLFVASTMFLYTFDILCREEGIPAFEELFLYACPKFISANPPPYEYPVLLSSYVDDPPVEPAQRHLSLFLAEVRAQAPVPTLRSFLKLYTSLDAKKLANFLDADEEEMVQQMMVMKQVSRSVSRVEHEKGLLAGETVSTSDLDFAIDDVGFSILMLSDKLLIFCSFRIWSILRNRPLDDDMRGGSSGIRNMRRGCMILSRTHLFLLRRRYRKLHLLRLNQLALHRSQLHLKLLGEG